MSEYENWGDDICECGGTFVHAKWCELHDPATCSECIRESPPTPSDPQEKK